MNFLQAILFPMVVAAANFRPSSGNEITCTDDLAVGSSNFVSVLQVILFPTPKASDQG
ncbi:hypothetical protein OKW40_005684 [Paraburkholderia sp. RAU6.4a]|uniref:hypothetical protein n=1 Tax=Paraburkholderia sp. RAU6.4a TaxID=2991067 RepID=UPI003D2575AE